jgi:calcium-dependent protein kinase
MLTGNAPFNGNNDAEIIKAINKKKATYPENDFKNISDEAKDLLKHMICDADKRFNVNQIIEHNWLVKVVPNSEKELDDFNQDNFKEFVKIPKLKRDILMFIVDNLGDFDIQLLKDVFVQMDVNKDGTLTLQEFKDGIIKLFPTENPPEITEENENENQNENENEKEKENNENQEVKIKLDDETLKKNKEIVDKAEELFNTFDLTSEGRFDYNDFIINSLDRHLILMEEKLFMAFWMMDRDGSGKLDKTEIKQALGLDLDNATLEKLIGQYDLNGDGEIDYLEFLNMMLNPPPKEEEVETGKKKK